MASFRDKMQEKTSLFMKRQNQYVYAIVLHCIRSNVLLLLRQSIKRLTLHYIRNNESHHQ